jgi:predicted nuclease of predicted toxin-antitoxin system
LKKRFAAKSSEKQHDVFALLLDETLAGTSILRGLKEYGIPAVPLQDVVNRGATDEEVLASLVSRPDLYLLTRDKDFRYHSSTKERLVEAGAGVFVITSAGNKSASEIVSIVRLAWRGMQRFVDHNQRPFVAKVSTPGHVELHR